MSVDNGLYSPLSIASSCYLTPVGIPVHFSLCTMHIGGKVPFSVQNSHLLLLLVCLCYLTLVVLPSMQVHLSLCTYVQFSYIDLPVVFLLFTTCVDWSGPQFTIKTNRVTFDKPSSSLQDRFQCLEKKNKFWNLKLSSG